MATPEDKINATNIHAGIAGQVISASLVLMGILVGYFDVKNLNPKSLPGIFTLIAIVLLMTSLIVGSLGLKKLRDNGNNGFWDYSKTHLNFRIQTLLCFLSIIIFAFIALSSSDPPEEYKKLEEINMNIKKMVPAETENYRETKLEYRILALEKEIDSLKEANHKKDSLPRRHN